MGRRAVTVPDVQAPTCTCRPLLRAIESNWGPAGSMTAHWKNRVAPTRLGVDPIGRPACAAPTPSVITTREAGHDLGAERRAVGDVDRALGTARRGEEGEVARGDDVGRERAEDAGGEVVDEHGAERGAVGATQLDALRRAGGDEEELVADRCQRARVGAGRALDQVDDEVRAGRRARCRRGGPSPASCPAWCRPCARVRGRFRARRRRTAPGRRA